MNAAVEIEDAQPDYPEGQYAKLEMMGHRTLWGRISEVTQFGAAMLKIEPIVGGKIVGEVLTGAASIYCLTKVSAVTAFGMAPSKAGWGNETLKLLAPPEPSIDEARKPLEINRREFLRDDDGAVGEDHEDEYNSEHPDHPDFDGDEPEGDEIPEAPTPRNSTLDICDCGHFRERHSAEGTCACLYDGCDCGQFKMEMPF